MTGSFYKLGGIYSIVNKINGKRYVGSAVILNERRNTHFYFLRHGKHYNPHLQAAWNKYGESNFEFEILEEVEDKSQLTVREQHWMDFYKSYNSENGYNIEPDAVRHTHSKEMRKKIGDGNRGKFVSLETRQKQSAALLGENHPMFHKKLPKEWRDNVVKALIGRKRSKETIEKIRQANLGKNMVANHKL
jgi:group I intron endonuclease